jgi:hypothetical protein
MKAPPKPLFNLVEWWKHLDPPLPVSPQAVKEAKEAARMSGPNPKLKPGEWLDTLDPVDFSPEKMKEAEEASDRMFGRLTNRKNSPNESASTEQKSRCYGLPDRPEGLEEEAEHVGSIYYVPGKGDIVVSWNAHFLRDIRENGFTKALVEWANKLAKAIAKEFRSKAQ